MSKKSKRNKKIKNEPIVNLDMFDFQNGDVYIGKYQLTEDRKVTREGIGLYETFDGDSYFGIWKDDLPLNNMIINFIDSCKFNGELTLPSLLYNCEQGLYRYPDGSEIKCTWTNGVPEGFMQMLDPRGHLWSGYYDEVFSQVLLKPENYLLPKHGYRWPKRQKPPTTIIFPMNELDRNSEELNRLAEESIKREIEEKS